MGIDFDKALNAGEQIIGTGKQLAALTELTDPDEKIIQRPRGIRVPHAHFADALWIHIQPKELTSQTKAARGENATKSSKESLRFDGTRGQLPLFKFLAPVELQEAIIHEWQPYESIVTRMMQKGVDLHRTFSDANAVVQPTYREAEKLVKKVGKGLKAGDIKAGLRNIVKGMTESTVPRVKLDTPLVYQDSTRRTYTFTFYLIDEGNTFKDVVYPVKQLEWLSTPGYSQETGEFIGFSPPHIFEVTTYPGTKFINIQNAALTSVQPIYRQPYRDGYPTMCELNLTFTEIEPLYKRQIEKGQQGTVTVSITPGVRLSLGDRDDLSIAGISGRKYADKFSANPKVQSYLNYFD